VVRLRRDQFTGGNSDPMTAAIAAARGCRGAVISHRSAALIHALPLVGGPPPLPDVTVPPNGTGDLQAAHLYRASLRDVDVVEINGVPVTSIARTVVDMGRHRPTSTMVAAADYVLHEKLTTLDELRDVADSCRGWPKVDRAMKGLFLVDARAESPLESISRLTMNWLRLPPPEPQVLIRNDRGVVIARTDFYWDEFGVVGEADGRGKLREHDDLVDAWDRHEDLDQLGLVVVRWGWADVTRGPRQFDVRIRRSFERGRRRDALGLPRLWSVAPR
jgi:hypothetical protein